ncbi:MAG: prephenate dehydrogenase [Betaproteobacteria bacterium RBG_16_64_9]|nr:MAG: prephenate dehydrogenase [Betaproteobacteria bacterium RBG_16_64_9]OGA26904.1 MAG: prephenate dehydrogenase [Betaproteobacteria bacterium RIFCSPLOWO2_02_FULL_65_24]OGA87987.1 MAG: prephenate dehydrogenase [Betaproteobacteria bacterium RIFCSPLOWO2_12_FULL_66_14]
MKPLGRLVIVGVGLIGGSFGLALRQAGAVERIVGVGRRKETLERARRLAIIDEAAPTLECVREADMVMLAMPVGQTREVLAQLAPHLGPATVVTDAGSTKHDVVAAAREVLGSALERFVPGHPVAGTEHSGPDAAFAGLFRGRKVIITPLAETSPQALSKVRAAWEACGAQVQELPPDMHDQVLALVSHLPHLLAFALVDQVARHEQRERLFSYAAGGFRDFTRIASSHPEMWRDICLANRAAVLAELSRYQGHLTELRRALEAADGASLEAVFSRAREARNRWLEERDKADGDNGSE